MNSAVDVFTQPGPTGDISCRVQKHLDVDILKRPVWRGQNDLDNVECNVEPGYRFDAILVEANRPDSNLVIWEDLDTGDDALQKIIYNAGRQDIRKV